MADPEIIPKARAVIAKWTTERTPGRWSWEKPSGASWPQYDESLVNDVDPVPDTVLFGWGYDASGIEGSDADRALIAATAGEPALLEALGVLLERGAAAVEGLRDAPPGDVVHMPDGVVNVEATRANAYRVATRELAEHIGAVIVAADERTTSA